MDNSFIIDNEIIELFLTQPEFYDILEDVYYDGTSRKISVNEGDKKLTYKISNTGNGLKFEIINIKFIYKGDN